MNKLNKYLIFFIFLIQNHYNVKSRGIPPSLDPTLPLPPGAIILNSTIVVSEVGIETTTEYPGAVLLQNRPLPCIRDGDKYCVGILDWLDSRPVAVDLKREKLVLTKPSKEIIDNKPINAIDIVEPPNLSTTEHTAAASGNYSEIENI